MPSGLILRRKGKIPTCSSKWERVGNVIDGLRRRGPNESRDKDSLSIKWQWIFRRADERVEVRVTSKYNLTIQLLALHLVH